MRHEGELQNFNYAELKFTASLVCSSTPIAEIEDVQKVAMTSPSICNFLQIWQVG